MILRVKKFVNALIAGVSLWLISGCSNSTAEKISIIRFSPFEYGTSELSDGELRHLVDVIEREARIPMDPDPFIVSELTTDKSDFWKFYTQIKVGRKVYVIGHLGKLGEIRPKFTFDTGGMKPFGPSGSHDNLRIVPAKAMPILDSHGRCWALNIAYDVKAEAFVSRPDYMYGGDSDAACMGVGG